MANVGYDPSGDIRKHFIAEGSADYAALRSAYDEAVAAAQKIEKDNADLDQKIRDLNAKVKSHGPAAEQITNAAATFDALRGAGVDPEIVALAEQGFRRTREALPVLLPMLSSALPTGDLPTLDDEFPPIVIGRSGLPTFVFDAFSWEGKSALARFLKRNTSTGRWLRRYVPAERRMAVLAGGLFRIEGGLVRQRVEWPCAITLRWLADSGFHGLKLSDPAGFLDMIRADLPTIDEERADVR